MPFKPGQSGNPKGRKTGSRNRTTIAVEELLEGEAEKLTRKAIDLALEGDTPALRLCLDRICPARKDRPVSFEVRQMENAADVVLVMSGVVQSLAVGDMTPSEAQSVAGVIETFRRTLETEDHEKRLAALEGK
jgi:hypothetical protein